MLAIFWNTVINLELRLELRTNFFLQNKNFKKNLRIKKHKQNA